MASASDRHRPYSAVAVMFDISISFSIRLEGGKMALSLDAYTHGLRKTWRDDKRHLVESYFADFACVMAYVAGVMKDKGLKKAKD